ncbi:MAG TPA: stalk domain-containing protein [Bacillota bacterium]|nr:stalk domain-containing protein [Bacillota bacterium]
MRAPRRLLIAMAVGLALVGATGSTAAGTSPPTLWIEGRELRPAIPPAMIDGHTLVPVRAVAEALGARVDWVPERQEVAVAHRSRRIQLRVGAQEALVDGRPVRLPASPRMVGERVMAPLRFVAESMGSFVAWDPRGPAIHVSTNPHHLPAGGVVLSDAPFGEVANARHLIRLVEPGAGLIGADLRLRVAGRVLDPSYVKVQACLYQVPPAFAGGAVPDRQALASLMEGQEPLLSRLVSLTENRFEFDLWFEDPGDYIVLLSVVSDYREFGAHVSWKWTLTHWFRAVNWSREARYLVPTSYEIDSDHPEVYGWAQTLTAGRRGREAVLAIHDWVARNVQYDTERLAAIRGGGEVGVPILRASDILSLRRGVCQDYAVLAAALLRAAGFRARVVTGIATPPGGEDELHAWNQVWVDGRWLSFDVTWNSGHVEDGRFVARFSRDYFDPPEAAFARTHRAETAPRPVSP